MPKLPYMQFYTSDWYSGTKTLNHRVKGYYIDLLCLIWNRGKTGKLRINRHELANLWNIPNDFFDPNTPQEWDEQIDNILIQLSNNFAITFKEILDEKDEFLCYEILQKRIRNDQNRLKINAKRQRDHRDKHTKLVTPSVTLLSRSSNRKVTPKKSEVIYKNKDRGVVNNTTPLGEVVNNTTSPQEAPKIDPTEFPTEVKSAKSETDLQKVVKGWKMLNSIPIEGAASQAWDRVHFPRHAKSAKALLDLFGDWEKAVEAMEYVYMHLVSKRLSCTIETIVKHSDLYREYKAGKSVL